MPTKGRPATAGPVEQSLRNRVLLLLCGIVVGVIIGIFFEAKYRGPIRLSVQAQGYNMELDVSEQITLTELLNTLLEKNKGAVMGELEAKGFYLIPSLEAAAALRRFKETDDNRDFAREVRKIMYDLDGPFARDTTFLEAEDDRLINALDDLFQKKPASPLIVRLWEDSLNWSSIFSIRKIDVLIKEDQDLHRGTAATCVGSILLNRDSQVSSYEEGEEFITVRIAETKPCSAASPADLLGGKEATVWISSSDMHALIRAKAQSLTAASELHATLFAMPRYLTNRAEPEQ